MKNFRFAVCVLQFAVFSIAAAAGAPDGVEWQDSLRLAEGKEKSRAFFFSHDRLKDALGIFPAKANRRVRSLNSATEWKFNWSKDPASRPIGFQNPSFDVSNWPSIRVPCSWQAFGANGSGGWGTPLYTNIRYPFAANAPRVMDTPPQNFTNYAARNPVGSYRRDFDISKKDLENEIYLKFDGVDSFFYLWVNGQYVGFAKDSRSPAEFDVTPFLHEGSNTVALEVYRYSDGSYLEDQDMFRLSGIFRDTWLLVRPKVRVRDFFVTASPNGAEWIVKTEVAIDNRSGKPVREDVEVTLYDWKTKKEIKGADAETSLRIAAGAEAKTELTFAVRNPKLWSAEEPNCYVAVVELDGREYVSSIFGFRTSEVRNGRYFLNGQKIKLKGANRHESDPMFGHYVPEWRHRQDVEMLKAANCNAVRNSHYPQPDFFYFLCDTEGLYLVDEANVESHGYGYGDESLSHRPEWLPATVDRNLSMLERNKNHPSVIIWSYGNEAGPGENFAAARDAIKSRDTTRPTHYERDNILADMDSNQYP
ncbi:MAG: beta-galactosidase, partial [Kiritimatiellae bacterium]|nr:beta-galactosidase [Kiritimatiellia bacterium]